MKTKTVYISEDGTEFLSQTECQRYDIVTILVANIRNSMNHPQPVDLSRRIAHGILDDFHVALRHG
jgi:hypothetical protein